MKKQTILRSALCLLLLAALMLGGLYGIDRVTAPIIEAKAKALLGDAELIYDRADPAASTLTVAADSVQRVYRDDTKQTFTLNLSTSEGYSHGPIELTLVVDSEGKIVSLQLDSSADDKDFGEAFLPSFTGADSALSGVELVGGVTFTTAAIRKAVNEGMEAMIENGLFAAGEKSAEQLLTELMAEVFPGLHNKAGAVQGEELEGSGNLRKGYLALNGSGAALFAEDAGEQLLAVVTPFGGVRLYNTEGEDVTAAHASLEEEAAAFAAGKLPDLSETQTAALLRLLGEDAKLEPVAVPGLSGCVTGVYVTETAEGKRYAFAAHPYGYANEVMDIYFVLDESGAIAAMRASELILHSEYFTNYTLDESSYKAGLIGLTADSYTGEQTLISGATMTSDAMASAMNDVFEAFAKLREVGA